MGNQFSTDTQLAWLRAAIQNPTKDNCIIWPWPVGNHRYGVCALEGRQVLAHRYAYKLHYGHYPEPCGLHTCDVRMCVNPLHVFAGTRRDNNVDRMNKGRNGDIKGEAHPLTHLTNDDIRKIRSMYASGEFTQAQLARTYKVDQTQISQIVRRKSWKHLE